MVASCDDCLDMKIRTNLWETGEGSGTHKEEAEESLSSDNGKADSSGAFFCPKNHHVEVSKVDPPSAESGTHADDVVLPPKPDDGMGHSSDAVERVGDLTDNVSEDVPPGEGTPSAFSLFEDSKVFWQHFLLGYNHPSPLFKMGLDINVSDIPRLIWDFSLASGKGEEDYNLMDVTPLALWDPNGGLNLATKDCEIEGIFFRG